jgi:hypothetical protein
VRALLMMSEDYIPLSDPGWFVACQSMRAIFWLCLTHATAKGFQCFYFEFPINLFYDFVVFFCPSVYNIALNY